MDLKKLEASIDGVNAKIKRGENWLGAVMAIGAGAALGSTRYGNTTGVSAFVGHNMRPVVRWEHHPPMPESAAPICQTREWSCPPDMTARDLTEAIIALTSCVGD